LLQGKKYIFSYKAMQIPLGQNRKRGRPANTTTALLMQPGESPSITGTATCASATVTATNPNEEPIKH
jgi:hypothetical protein